MASAGEESLRAMVIAAREAGRSVNLEINDIGYVIIYTLTIPAGQFNPSIRETFNGDTSAAMAWLAQFI